MEIILNKDIAKVGYKNDLVVVKNGYARNYLIPQGLAKFATISAKKVLAENIRQQAHKATKVQEEAAALAGKMAGVEIKIGAKAGESGKIFGSVNTIQLAEALANAGCAVDRRQITITNEPIKMLGDYEAVVDLHKEVKQTITFSVIEE